MQSILNWTKLVDQGRAKDIGVYWNDEELNAIHKLKIPIEYVRSGVITEDGYVKELERESKYGRSLDKESISKIREIAAEEGVVVTPETPKSVLVREIKIKKDQKKQAAKQAEAVKQAKEKFEKDQAKTAAKAETMIAKEKSNLESPKTKK